MPSMTGLKQSWRICETKCEQREESCRAVRRRRSTSLQPLAGWPLGLLILNKDGTTSISLSHSPQRGSLSFFSSTLVFKERCLPSKNSCPETPLGSPPFHLDSPPPPQNLCGSQRTTFGQMEMLGIKLREGLKLGSKLFYSLSQLTAPPPPNNTRTISYISR